MFVDLYITHKTLFFATCWRIYVIWRDGHRTNQWMNLNKSFWWTNLKWTNILKESKFPSLMVTVSSAQLTAFAVLLLAVIKQRCITAGAPFWIGGELPVFVVRPRAPNREVRTVTIRYKLMYRATPNIYIYIYIYFFFMYYSNVAGHRIHDIILDFLNIFLLYTTWIGF